MSRARAEARIEQAQRGEPVERRAVIVEMLRLPAHRPVPVEPEPGADPRGSPRRIPRGSAPRSISSMRSRKRPPAPRAACHPTSAERTWPRCRWPVGLGAKRVTTSLMRRRASQAPPRRDTARRFGYASPITAEDRMQAWPSYRLSGPSHPPASRRQAAPAGDPAAWARRRRQRSDRAGALLGAGCCRTPSSCRRTRRSPATWRPTATNGSACRIARRRRVLAGVRAAAPILDAFIDEALAERGLDDGEAGAGRLLAGHDDVALCRAAPRQAGGRRSSAIPGGCIARRDCWRAEMRSRPPVLLVHGTEDPVVPSAGVPLAVERRSRRPACRSRH